MTGPASTGEPCVEAVSARAFTVPTEFPQESDGTLTWSATSLVLAQAHADGITGLGYTYCHPAAASVITGPLADTVVGFDARRPAAAHRHMWAAIRNLGHVGIAAMAVSALDIALWDLHAKLGDASLADVLPRCRDGIEAYGSGGFTNLTDPELFAQVAGWARQGHSRVKIKVAREPDRDLERVRLVRDAVGPDVEIMVDANGAYTAAEASAWAHRFAELGVRWLEEPVSSQDLAGLAQTRRRAAPGIEVTAGEYLWNLPDAHAMIDADAVDVLQGDVTRCGGITGLLAIDGLCQARNLPFSAHCAPAVSAQICCAMPSARHVEYFADHARIEQTLFRGVLVPQDGILTPDCSRSGLGLELDETPAADYEVTPEALPAASR